MEYPERLSLRKVGRKPKYQDVYHVNKREIMQRVRDRKKWRLDHEKEDQKAYEEAMYENAETVPDEVLEKWEKERRELLEPDTQ